MARQYIKIFFDWDESTSELTLEEKGSLIDALIAHAKGNGVHMIGNERFVFPVFKAQIDRDADAYKAIVTRNHENGSKGGRPRKNPVGFLETQKSQDKEEDKEKEEDEDYSSTRPDFSTIEVYAANNLRSLSPGNMQELVGFKNELSEDMIRHAIDEACASGKRTYGYVRTIMQRYVDEGLKSLGDVLADEGSRRSAQQVKQAASGPRWG